MYDATTRAQAIAALSMCSSLLLMLAERDIVDVSEVRDALDDAASAHRNYTGDGASLQDHRQAAMIIERLMDDFDPGPSAADG